VNDSREPFDQLSPEGLLALQRALARRAGRARGPSPRRLMTASDETASDETMFDNPAAFEDDLLEGLDVEVDAAMAAGNGQAFPPRPGLADRMLRTALAARPAGRPTGPWASEDIGPFEAFTRSLDDLAGLLDSLAPGEWDVPVHAPGTDGWVVRDVVAHLVAVERYQLTVLGRGDWAPPPGTEADHTAMTRPTVAELHDVPLGELRRQWDDAVHASRAACREEVDRPGRLQERVTFAGLPFKVGTMLVLRAFEVWTHGDDIRAALGRPLTTPDGPRLTLMSDLAVHALPLGLALSGRTLTHRTARIVLTGPGGGTWSQPLGIGEPPGEPEVVLVADVVDFCRLVARRLPADAIDCHIEGDEALGADVLAGAAVFAA
jgi:uncharacterized protein (TIGR03083 family)